MLIEDHSEKLFEGNRVRLTHFPLYHYLFEAQTHFLKKGQEKPDLSRSRISRKRLNRKPNYYCMAKNRFFDESTFPILNLSPISQYLRSDKTIFKMPHGAYTNHVDK